jgi:spermidine/putrescine transport system substrate-binding protein
MMRDQSQSGLVRARVFGSMTRRGFVAGSGAVSVLVLGGVPLHSARAATTVTFVGWQGYDTPLAEYAKQNDIVIDATYIGDSNQIISKLTSGAVGTVDLVTPNAPYVPLLVKLDTLASFDESKLPNLAKVLPLFADNASVRSEGKLYAVPYVWGAVPMMYDPAAIPEAPQSWRDLLKPEYTDKVAMLDNLNNIQLAAKVVTDAEVPTRLTQDQLAQAVDFLIDVKKQSRVIATSYGDMADAMARGEVVITFNGWEVMVNMAAKKGKTIAYTYPQEGTFGWCDCYCIVKDAPNLEVAHALANEAISVPVQLKAGQNELLGIVNTDAITELSPEAKALYPYDTIDEFSKRVGIYPAAPLEPEGDIATFDDWKKEYLRFKNA